MLCVRATAPTRIDLAGGTLDLWPIHHLLDRKATVNVGVTVDASVSLAPSADKLYHLISDDQGVHATGSFAELSQSRDLPLFGLLLGALWHQGLPPLTMTTTAKSPAGAGLGGSSCLGITIAGALDAARRQLDPGPRLSEQQLVQTVQDVEARLIRTPTGMQDYWGAVRGRINILRFPYGSVEVETLPPAHLSGLTEELLLCYSGKSRASAINNWEIFKRLFDGDQQLLSIFNDIGALADDCAVAAKRGDLTSVLRLSEAEWRLRTRLWPAIESPETKALDQAARQAGATFSRVCGAGGGGVMAVFAAPERRSKVAASMAAAGGTILAASVAQTGLTVDFL